MLLRVDSQQAAPVGSIPNWVDVPPGPAGGLWRLRGR